MRKLLLIFLLLISCRVLAEDNQFTRISTYQISAVNPTPLSNKPGIQFPGYRGANQLIIYTPEYGSYTGTNEFGREAAVRNGRVFGFNGANSFIPVDGYIISGHGRAKTWINQNLIEGAFVKIDPARKVIESVITPESYLYKAEHRLNEVQKVILHYKRNLPGYEYTSAQNYYTSSLGNFQNAKYYLSQGNYKQAMDEINSSLLFSQKAFYYAIPAYRDEFHGVWLRPVEKNTAEIIQTLDKLKRTGIDNIFLETYYQGYTIFPSSTMTTYSLTLQRAEFQGWDPLKEWINQAHKRNMKVHVWFQAFYAGNDDVKKTPGHILFVYPEWANVQRRNAMEDVPMPSGSEHNGYFLDPANHLVRQFLLSLITEITSNYDVDGLNIDYVRYPKSLTPDVPGYIESTWGYSKYARDEFNKLTGKDPLHINEGHCLWPAWIEYRQKKVTELVSQLRQVVGKKDITISAVIFPNIEETPIAKLQNWKEWAQNCYIDAFTPLIMSSDDVRAEKSVNEIASITCNNVKIYPGLFEPFTAGTPTNLLSQIVAIRTAGAAGVVIFDNAHLDEDFIEALNTRIFRN
ncbi:MAG: hypothetical protein A2Y25_06010 [Candidatus Melainabacteria bacterium GWF2_37_15]|nr:MAG: hypothetical protein A2Y25_06010 [Candidatus Melainabacteria bacterium GWF2_37_15]